MINKDLKQLIERYKNINPLIIKRTISNTKSINDAIYMLDNLPKYPIVWNETHKKWITQNASVNKTQ